MLVLIRKRRFCLLRSGFLEFFMDNHFFD